MGVRHITNMKRKGRTIVLHAVLIAGSFLFSIPFIWLFSTSCKVPDEMFPPKWLPQIPGGVEQSPYIALRENERAVKPVGVALEDWQRTKEPILYAISEKVSSLAPELPEFYQPYHSDPALAEGLMNRLVKRAPDGIFEKVADFPAAWFAERVTVDLAKDVFEDGVPARLHFRSGFPRLGRGFR